jgi:hypothetical protein
VSWRYVREVKLEMRSRHRLRQFQEAERRDGAIRNNKLCNTQLRRAFCSRQEALSFGTSRTGSSEETSRRTVPGHQAEDILGHCKMKPTRQTPHMDLLWLMDMNWEKASSLNLGGRPQPQRLWVLRCFDSWLEGTERCRSRIPLGGSLTQETNRKEGKVQQKGLTKT